ncbi:PfkB family carbohydrate kinase [Microbacterium sp. ARD32]|uniref:carbohydrate kinase family protein n=1 Tax=Microbacterium sp. ARD32 TaxID=2962577 RepID=UPI002882BCCF|nr:PfkB family carbohydrate kinase [Microbacterium sp. ARD32]MDT0156077.1 PfkB family carbohydrate kinase [Microbacterium sp. ARD32]
MTRILVAGDANLDLVLRGDVRPRFGQAEQLLDGADLVLGSSAGICAAGLARLGVDTALVARVGDDLFGARTRELLTASGVDCSAVSTVDAPTGISVILSAPEDRSILTLAGAISGLTGEEVLRAATNATHVHFASSFLVPALTAQLPEVMAELRRRGVTTSLDTNWDPDERWHGIAECLPLTDVLLPNAAEAIALARAQGETASDAETAARALAARGPLVVVKDGAAGGLAVADGEVLRAPGLDVQVTDTTGAGDSFDAGFLAAWTAGMAMIECLHRAAAAGSLSTRGAGGTGGQATDAEIDAALAAGRAAVGARWEGVRGPEEPSGAS